MELQEKEKNIIVGPSTLSLELHNLSSFTTYSIEVRAFTVKGNGTPSQVIFAGNVKTFCCVDFIVKRAHLKCLSILNNAGLQNIRFNQS